MKKIMTMIAIIAVTIAIIPKNTYAYSNVDSIEKIRSFIYSFDGIETDVVFVRNLKDINDEYNFELYELVNNGYVIVAKTNGNIIDISYDNLPSSKDIYYIGPSNFVRTLDEISTRSLNSENQSLDDVKKATENILTEETVSFEFVDNQDQLRGRPQPSKPSVISGGTEVGIPDANMDLFNNNTWVVSGNTCGAYAGACALTYMQKYVGGYFSPTTTINNSETYAKYIIGRFKKYITGAVLTPKVLNTINTIMLADNSKTTHSGSITSSESTYKSKISAKRPVIFGLTGAVPGNSYGNHFVVGYRYVAYNGALWFKAYDGWEGNSHRGWINRNWIVDGLYIV